MALPVILTDIEGTTSSIDFVKNVLFPYATEQLPAFIQKYHAEPAVQEQLDAVAQEVDCNRHDLETITRTLLNWIAEDRKATPLKTLQGLLWKAGYTSGAYQAHIYPDALKALEDWKQFGHKLYVYSSGSTMAQELFFQYSEAGDIRPLFSGHFDTTIGHKREPESYTAIANTIGNTPANILFLSDIIEELDAAKIAGMQTCLLVREADTAYDMDTIPCTHDYVTSFDQINIR